MQKKELIYTLIIIVVGLTLHTIGSFTLNNNRKAKSHNDDLAVAAPVPIQLFIAGGDRYLASNINIFRTFMLDNPYPTPETISTQAKLQSTASFFNPAHEDNYYLAAATISWQNEIPTAQQILYAAMTSRPQDIYPGFFYAFNKKYFEHDIAGAIKTLNQVALRADKNNYQALMVMAARWADQSNDSIEAINILQAMIKQTNEPALKEFLEQRVTRLKGLLSLQTAAHQYAKQTGLVLTQLDSLVQSGIINQIPVDPIGQGYGLSPDGKPILLSAKTN
ncbi:hypothetical protein K4H28_10975 [Deefgea tanakiae]|uniref:Uncharacterized protein n=1 Tax=Deefgea tanakiae TaxID=2865840 RepID=A0ABX8Z2P6_9NEIS|nr:hypothetical protein [Deefgea tanakiae]QZA76837.1 hypothetical protein K4H28_10975 [Deefgea tanakiae]